MQPLDRPFERSAKPQLKNAIFGSKLSFLGVHYIVLQYILIASFASPGKLRAESLFTPPLQRLKHVWLPCAFFCSAPTVWYAMIPVNATANHSCTILSQTQKQVWIQLLEEVWMSNTCLDTKLFAIIRNKEIGQDQECQHTFAHLPLCELGIPACFHTWTDSRVIVFGCFWDFTISFLHIKMHIFTW